MNRLALVVGCVATAGCATEKPIVFDTRPVARLAVAYRGDYFAITHEGAYPGVFDKSRGLNISDGRLQGKVCNVDLDYDASWYGTRLHLDGHLATGQQTRSFLRTEGDVRLTLEMTESAPGQRRIVGGTPPQWHSEVATNIEIDVTPDRLVGRIGTRT
ncbi:MAG TPA: hypothetical protein VHV78_06960, partial [Gemmatimonadaceae bacterium]|nr:hypothetical protein [Gemmatimonadaceae bacterium]